ncbi:MAG: hypothetical protein JWR25_1182 [Noviherbaspirillum sp.]|jgi:hypothetical protein|nr:hypothetical protein [Noviherbaspirillum sp.]
MYPYSINKLISDLTPEKLDLVKEKDQAFFSQYKLSVQEIEGLHEAVSQHRFKSLVELGVIPNFLYRLARLCGYGAGQFADLVKK